MKRRKVGLQMQLDGEWWCGFGGGGFLWLATFLLIWGFVLFVRVVVDMWFLGWLGFSGVYNCLEIRRRKRRKGRRSRKYFKYFYFTVSYTLLSICPFPPSIYPLKGRLWRQCRSIRLLLGVHSSSAPPLTTHPSFFQICDLLLLVPYILRSKLFPGCRWLVGWLII